MVPRFEIDSETRSVFLTRKLRLKWFCFRGSKGKLLKINRCCISPYALSRLNTNRRPAEKVKRFETVDYFHFNFTYIAGPWPGIKLVELIVKIAYLVNKSDLSAHAKTDVSIFLHHTIWDEIFIQRTKSYHMVFVTFL